MIGYIMAETSHVWLSVSDEDKGLPLARQALAAVRRGDLQSATTFSAAAEKESGVWRALTKACRDSYTVIGVNA